MLYNIFFYVAQHLLCQIFIVPLHRDSIVNHTTLIFNIMSNKLTKNDSMPVEQTKFEVLTAAFDAILARNGVRIDYYFCWAKKRNLVANRKIYQEWLDWAKSREPLSWLLGAFLFDDNHISYLIWLEVANQWLEYIKPHLN